MMIKKILLCALLSLGILSLHETYGQSQPPKEFTIIKARQYWTDQDNKNWEDLNYVMRVRLHPEYAQSLGTQEISAGNLKFSTGAWKGWKLQKDAKGTYAEGDVLVYKNSPESVIYQVELWKPAAGSQGPVTVPFASNASSKWAVSNKGASSQPIKVNARVSPTVLLKDRWMIIVGVLLLGAIMIYFLIFRWLFAGLLHQQRWGVGSAQNFTWSLSILIMLALVAGLAFWAIGAQPLTWIIIGVIGAFWVLHGVVWLVSGNKQA